MPVVASALTGLTSTVTLNDGHRIPVLGLGVENIKTGSTTYSAVSTALEAGYRLFDTSSRARNEADLGKAIRDFTTRSGTSRQDVCVITKLWESDHGYEAAKNAIERSVKRLGLDYVDVYLIQSPALGKKLRLESWKALEECRKMGIVKSIGVSNYGVSHIKEILAEHKVPPAINQIELHPFNARPEIVKFCQEHSIACCASSPLTRGQKLNDEHITQIAKRKSCTSAQLLIRWSLQRGFVCIPRSSTGAHILENADVFRFSFGPEMTALDLLDSKFLSDPTWDPSTSA